MLCVFGSDYHHSVINRLGPSLVCFFGFYFMFSCCIHHVLWTKLTTCQLLSTSYYIILLCIVLFTFVSSCCWVAETISCSPSNLNWDHFNVKLPSNGAEWILSPAKKEVIRFQFVFRAPH